MWNSQLCQMINCSDVGSHNQVKLFQSLIHDAVESCDSCVINLYKEYKYINILYIQLISSFIDSVQLKFLYCYTCKNINYIKLMAKN